MKKLLYCIFLVAAHAVVSAQSHGGNGVRPPNPGNGALPPGGTSVIVYKDMKYSGMSRALGQGQFTTQTLGFLGNNVSSIYVPPGTSITVYNARGASKTFTSSVANLAQYGWDDKIISGVVKNNFGGGNGGNHGGNRPPAPPPPFPSNSIATLYRDAHYRGGSVTFGMGRSPHLGMGADRAASSLQLARGFAVRVYSGIMFTGHFRTFTSSVPNLGLYGWNDLIRSIEVIRL